MITGAYSTSEVAKLIGIHPNTVRLYEEWGLITPPTRKLNGYRVYTDLHIFQFKIARTALQIEVLQNGLRKKAINIIKATAKCDFDYALLLTNEYMSQLDLEIAYTNETVGIVKEMCSDKTNVTNISLNRKEVSQLLDTTIDTLRNWEMNGLIRVKRKENGYRVYTESDIRRFKIIRALRSANYSLSSILRMLNSLDADRYTDIASALNEPKPGETIISACDKLSLSLKDAKKNAGIIQELLNEIKTII